MSSLVLLLGLGAVAVAGPSLAVVALLTAIALERRKPVVGDTLIDGPVADLDPAAVRRYREAHPAATITDAIAALTEHGRTSTPRRSLRSCPPTRVTGSWPATNAATPPPPCTPAPRTTTPPPGPTATTSDPSSTAPRTSPASTTN